MMNTRLRLAELGRIVAPVIASLAVLGLAPATSLAEPGPTPARASAPARHDLHYVYLYDDHDTTMSADSKELERARRFKRPGEPVLWFRDGGQDYVVRDAATLKQVDAALKPVRDLGEAQGKLGSQQGELGTLQGELGARQGVLGTRQGTLAVRDTALALRDQSGALSPADRDDVARQRQELRQQQKAVRQEMRALDRPMRDLGQRMAALGEQMAALGEQMAAASAKAEADLRTVLQRAIASGAARPAA